jgi:hypothetical protein
VTGRLIEWNLAACAALVTGHCERAFSLADGHIVPQEGAEFLDAQARMEQQLHNSQVADAVGLLHDAHKFVLLKPREPPGPRPVLPHGSWESPGTPVGDEPRICSPLEEAFQGREVTINAGGLEAPFGYEPAFIVPQVCGGDLRRIKQLVICLLELRDKGLQIPTVVTNSPAAVFCLGQKVERVFQSETHKDILSLSYTLSLLEDISYFMPHYTLSWSRSQLIMNSIRPVGRPKSP